MDRLIKALAALVLMGFLIGLGFLLSNAVAGAQGRESRLPGARP